MNFKDLLLKLLKSDSRLLDSEGELMGNKIQDFADKTDEKLIELLLDNPETRAKFFLKIKEVYVFKTSDFKFYLDENKIDNSYTQYENRIGLTSKGKFLKDSNDIVLDFPYKDCVLEGGQSTEEGTDTYFEWDEKNQHYTEKQSKRKEIFFNSVLAKDEIDRLLEPKAFANIKKFSPQTPEGGTINGFERDENGTIKDNLIIKGNNLLALHTLKKEFAGKVKLIYIDPPYNTGNDTFAYNDSFNHSTWLTFMRNRILVAKELLREDGFFFIQIDDYQMAYLKVLCDEIFNRENNVNVIVVKMSEASGVKMAHVDKKLPKLKEFILSYRKNNTSRLNPIKIKKESQGNKLESYLKYYKKVIENYNDPIEKWIITPIKEYLKNQGLETDDESIKKFQLENTERVVYRTNNKSFTNLNIEGSIALVKTKQGFDYVWWEGKQMLFLADYIDEYICDFWTDISTINLNKEGGVDLANGKKPEKLLKRIIQLVTKENDIVMDYHLGSGTTASVALKMKRQFIGIEQLDYEENDSIVRLKNTVKGDNSGISSEADVNWQGGGSFVYLELAKNNQNAIEQIQNCNSYEELIIFFDEMCEKYFLHYNVKVKQFREEISKEENFKKLALDHQKELFIKMLDLNQLYVNVSDMEDKKYNLSAADIAVTKDFYQL